MAISNLEDKLEAALGDLQRLEGLIEANTIVHSTLDKSTVLHRVLELAVKLLKASSASIFLIDEETNELVLELTTREGSEYEYQVRIPIGEGVVGKVAQDGIIANGAGINGNDDLCKMLGEIIGEEVHSYLCVPLRSRFRIIGTAQVFNSKDKRFFDKKDERLFAGFAQQATIALEKATLYEDLNALFMSVLKSLAAAIDGKDKYTRGHSRRVTEYSLAIADEMGLSQDRKREIRICGMLHDIGKVGIPNSVLMKPGPLTDEEWVIIRRHPVAGVNIISDVKQLKNLLPGIRQHHERVDGTGYPDGLSGDQISLLGKIICVADAFDAMTSERAYRKGMNPEEALDELERCAGTQFDSEIVTFFINAYKKKRLEKID